MKLKQVLIAVDQVANTLFDGYADETLSARTWRKRDRQPWKFLRPVIDGLFFWEKNHCQSAFESEVKRKHLPHAYRVE